MLNIVYLDTVDSTNNWCKAHAAELPFAVVAKEQAAGRGRYGRSFYSPEGGVYMSYAFRADYAADDVQLVTLAAAAAVHKVLQSHSDDDLGIKWVNDIYRGRRKIAGILCERVDDPNVSGGYFIIVGVGVNVVPCKVPSDLSNIIGFLSDDDSLSPASLAEELMAALDQTFGGCNSDISELAGYIDYYKSICHNMPDDINI